ncbi:MAG: hypothetical protein KDA75_15160, partial [Planctomycetaceae bacterium]|nr:hypothetical protein [Planctomycetaceae bacterium]
ESQTAALYPLNPLLYSALDLNTAYVASHLLHYILAFVGCWLLSERLGLNRWGALLAAVVYVYGWFPPRACLEWAIIGGAYLPLSLWCLEGWFQTHRRRHGVGLALLMALDLLAGHYNLAFITVVALGIYAVVRATRPLGSDIDRSSHSADRVPQIQRSSGDVGEPRGKQHVADQTIPASSRTFRQLLFPLLCLALGFGIAAPQLLPTWDLKRMSQRTESNAEFDPGYGHIPPWYLIQIATPWLWYGAEANPDQALNTVRGGGIPSATNKVEAHLYFGLLPLLLAMLALSRGFFTVTPLDPRLKLFAWIGLFGVVYATGWLLPAAEHLPGFGYFRGPGRWGLLGTLAVALLSGKFFSDWKQARPGFNGRCLLATILVLATVFDLYWVSRHQWYTFNVSDPPIIHRHESTIGQRLAQWSSDHGPARMLSPGPNLATLTGIASTPPYLGFGPDAYYVDGGRLPDPRFLQYLSGELTATDIEVEPQFTWLRNAGVTHLLSMKPLPRTFPVRLDWSGFDRLLNPSWARMSASELLYLYSIDSPRRRVFLDAPGDPGIATIVRYTANQIEIQVDCRQPCDLVLTDLPWPEWEPTLDDQPVEWQAPASNGEIADAASARLVQRRLAIPQGIHSVVWTYRPRMLYVGAIISSIAFLMLAALAAWKRSGPANFDRSSVR